MNGYDFFVDTNTLLVLKGELASKISSIEFSLEGMESAITDIGGQQDWESAVYDTLIEKFTDKKEALLHAISYLKAYEATISLVAEKAESLNTQISNICISE